MKKESRLNAIELRKNGLSVGAIAKQIGASKGSVSVWVRNVVLTDDQRSILESRSGGGVSQRKASAENKKVARERRLRWQEAGRETYRNKDKEYAFGCALFYGEGNKHRNTVRFCNTDHLLMKFLVNFFRKYWGVRDEEFSICVNCYLNNGLSIDDIQKYWLKVFDLPQVCLRKATLKSKYYDGKESSKHPYGVCSVSICRTDVVQNLFGSIKEAIGERGDRWIE